MKMLKQKQSINWRIEDEKTLKIASWKIAEELFDVINQEMRKVGDKDKIPSIDKVIWIVDIS